MQATYVYKQNLSAWLERYRVIANKGGTRSGKTYSLVSLFISVAVAGKKIREIDIVSESMPHLKRGALNDFNEILDREQLVDGVDYAVSYTHLTLPTKLEV